MKFDRNGILLADVAPSGVSRVDPNAASGNPRHDTRSGKFGRGGRQPNVQTPPNTDPLEFARMLDAAREAARRFDNLDAEEMTEFLKGRAKNPEVVDVAKFLALALEWRKNDLVDLLDSQLRSAGQRVKLSAGRGFVKASLGGLDENAQAEVLHRLEARGHSRQDLDKIFGRKVDDPEPAKKKRDQLQASMEFSSDMIELLDNKQEIPHIIELTSRIAHAFASEMPAPIVQVTPEIHVDVPEPKKAKKVIKRDEKGLIMEVEEVDG